jgi:hypothetical protein
MATTHSWTEGNGSGAGTLTANRTDSNWKNIDDSTSAYSSYPINSSTNSNSFSKYQCIIFSGTWNSLSALTYKIDNNNPATGLSIVGSVVTSGATPSTVATGDSAMSTTGLSANFVSSSTPYGTGTSSSTASGTIYANMLRTQLQTTSGYAAGVGDIASRTITASWTES